MATIPLAISGITSEVQRVAPYLPIALGAFAPFGITFQTFNYQLFEGDPEQSGTWSSLHSSLAAYSAQNTPPSPAHLVITKWPPSMNTAINGSLIDQMRGIAAVYTFADLYGDNSDLNAHRDLLIQVLIHEIGHMLNLIHSDGSGAKYCNSIQPTSDRLNEAVADAWAQAAQDIADNHEAVVVPPNPLLYYPFDRDCRNRLRAIPYDPQNLPWHSEFRGSFGDPEEIQDRSLLLDAQLHGGESVDVRGGLYFTLKITNGGPHPVRIPALVGPEFGSLRVAVYDRYGTRHVHRPARFECTGALATLLPGDTFLRSFAIASNSIRPLFAKEGEYCIEISLLHHHGAQTGSHGKATMQVNARPQLAAEPALTSLSKLVYGPPRKTPPRAAPEQFDQLPPLSPSYFHGHLACSKHIRHRGRRADLLGRCLDPRAPVAIRNAAALQLGLDRIQRGASYRKLLTEYQQLYPEAHHEDLLISLRKAGRSWEDRTK